MNQTLILKKVAEDILIKMPILNNLQAVILCGSVAKGIADEYSDIELKFIWKEIPTQDERDALFQNFSKKILFKEYFEDFEWYQTILLEDNTKIDISHCDAKTIDGIINSVINELNTSIDLQLFLSSLIDSEDLHGDIDGIKSKLEQYPAELSLRCIDVNLEFEGWTLRNALLAREDYLALHHVIDQTLLQMMRLLFALNKVYLRSYGFKWLNYQVNLIETKPIDLKSKLVDILNSNFDEKLPKIHSLLKEVFELVKKEYPDIDLTYSENILDFVRSSSDLKVSN